MSSLSDPLLVGSNTLKHRLVMAPLTRFRADENHVPLPVAIEYYGQRASVPGTLIITEATTISPRASGFPNVPGIYNPEQIHQWKKITDAIHKKRSYIYLQLWALGRAAHPEFLKQQGCDYLSSSATLLEGKSQPPRAMTIDEIHQLTSDHATAARNAIEAGFDGVEIHAANGYLIDQFTQDTCNKRTDDYGGSIPNRARFGLEVAKAVVDAIGAERTGIRLAPFSTFQGMKMQDAVPQFSYFIEGLRQLKLAYLHVVESRISSNIDVEATDKLDFALEIWGKTSPVLLAGGFKPDSAKSAIREYAENDVAIVFGRYFISNPDLPFRILHGVELTPYERSTFYEAKSFKGYADYPFSKEWEESDWVSKL